MDVADESPCSVQWERCIMRRLLCGLVVVCLFRAATSYAQSHYVYWTENSIPGQILRANPNGKTAPEELLARYFRRLLGVTRTCPRTSRRRPTARSSTSSGL